MAQAAVEEPPVQDQHVEPPVHDHRHLVDMFPHLDLEDTIRTYGHMSSDALAGYIVDNEATIPKKRKALKRKLETIPESDDESVGSADLSDWEDVDGTEDLLVSRLVAEVLLQLRRELQKPVPEVRFTLENGQLRKWLTMKFPGTRKDFVNGITTQFKNQVMPCAIACFLAENKFGHRLQKYAMNLTPYFWKNVAVALKKWRVIVCAHEVKRIQPNEAEKFDEFLNNLKAKFPQLFDGDRLSQDARHLKDEKETTGEEKVECVVCFDSFAVSKMVYCNPPVSNRSPSPNGPSTSAAAQMADVEIEVHSFCRTCLRHQAKAATEDMPMAEGGIGLKCLGHNCKNPVLFSEVRHLLAKDIRKRLEERVVEENLGLAGFNNLERCPKCNFAMVIDVPKEVNKVFTCQNQACCYEFCRICECEWDDDHFGVSCEELDKTTKKNKEQRDLEKKLNEIVVRKCPKCGLGFLKESGCNKMTCRCGMTQCYVCKESGINYEHYCQHLRDPNAKIQKCDTCSKTCLLWENAEIRDEQKIREVLNGRPPPLPDMPGPSQDRPADPMRHIEELHRMMAERHRAHIERFEDFAAFRHHNELVAEQLRVLEEHAAAQLRRRAPDPVDALAVGVGLPAPLPPRAAPALPGYAEAVRMPPHRRMAERQRLAAEARAARVRDLPRWAEHRPNPLYLQEQMARMRRRVNLQDPVAGPNPEGGQQQGGPHNNQQPGAGAAQQPGPALLGPGFLGPILEDAVPPRPPRPPTPNALRMDQPWNRAPIPPLRLPPPPRRNEVAPQALEDELGDLMFDFLDGPHGMAIDRDARIQQWLADDFFDDIIVDEPPNNAAQPRQAEAAPAHPAAPQP